MRVRSLEAPTMATPRGFRKRARSAFCTMLFFLVGRGALHGRPRAERLEPLRGLRAARAPVELDEPEIEIAERAADRDLADVDAVQLERRRVRFHGIERVGHFLVVGEQDGGG